MAQHADAAGPAVPPRRAAVVPRPSLFERLGQAGRVTEVSAPAGSGKTFLLRSWIHEAGLARRAAWVAVVPSERDPQRFWVSVLDALKHTAPGSQRVRDVTAAPDLDGWAIAERLLEDLDALEERVWLVIDDLHDLRPTETLRQLELLLMRAPPALRFVLATRRDLRLGLHRLRLEGELTEIRASDLRFTLGEARALMEAAGVQLSDSALGLLCERTEGWVAGLRLAALSLAGHPDAERFAAEFSGTERTVAEYLLAEVLERQPDEVRRLLLCTSVLDRVNGPLADLLTGGSGGERILQELEAANAFVVSLDAARSWFRYHRLFADLLELELRRTAPAELAALHGAAADWHAEHGYPIEAIRHAQAAENWSLATRLLSDQWFSLDLNGHARTAHELLAAFPAGAVAAEAELSALTAADALNRGLPEEAERQLAAATDRLGSVPPERREHLQAMLAVLRLALADLRGNLAAVVEQARDLLAPAEATEAEGLGIGDDLRALALIDLGITEYYALRLDQAERHLERGVALAQQIERPYLELKGQGCWAIVASTRSYALAEERATAAISLARRHGWTHEPVAAIAYLTLASTRVWQGRLDEAARWLEQAETALREEVHPVTWVLLHHVRGVLELARGRHEAALAALQAGERAAEAVIRPHPLATRMRAHRLQTLIKSGRTEQADRALAALDEAERETAEMRIVETELRLAEEDPDAAKLALAPVLDGRAPVLNLPVWLIQAVLLEAIASDAVGDAAAAERALERALDLAEPDGVLFPFLLHPAPGLLERHPRHRTAHGALIAEILALLAGRPSASPAGEVEPLREPLSESELRVLRYLPTNLSRPEIAAELYLSRNTVKTHVRHLYAKLGVQRRADAVERARALGLLAPSSRKR